MAIRKVVTTAKQKGSKPLTDEQRAAAIESRKREEWEKLWEERPRQEWDGEYTEEELIARGLFKFCFQEGRDADGKFQNEIVRPINSAYRDRHPNRFAAVAAERNLTEDQLLSRWPVSRQAISKIINGSTSGQREVGMTAIEAIACYKGWGVSDLYAFLIDEGRKDVAADGDINKLPPLRTTGAATCYLVLDTVRSILESGLMDLDGLRDVLVNQEAQVDDFAELVDQYRSIWGDDKILSHHHGDILTKAKLKKFAAGVKPDDEELAALHIAFSALEDSLPDDEVRLSYTPETLEYIRDTREKFLPARIELQEEKPGMGRRLAIAATERPPMI